MTAPEIGSEFALRPPDGKKPGRVIRSLVGHGPHQLVGSGREALRVLLADAASRGRTRVAFPAYLCETLLEALHPSQTPTFLATTETLAPSKEAISGFLRSGLPDDTVMIVAPYFGARWDSETIDAVEAAWAAGVEILEDRSHSLLSEPAQLDAKRGYASLRKWAALPDGGIAYGRAVEGLKPDAEAGGPSHELRREGMTAKAAWLDTGAGDKDTFLDLIRRGEAALSEVTGVRPMTEESQALLGAWDVSEIRARRQANGHHLLAGLRRIDGIQPLLRFGPDETPLGVPVLLDDRDRIRHALIAQHIYCPVHWALPSAVDPQRFAHEHAVSDRILTLVCDQRYEEADMDRILNALRRLV